MSEHDDLMQEIGLDEPEETSKEVTELPAPLDWTTLSIHEWQAELGRLRLWVGQLAADWALSPHVILPCWEQHASMVQVLSALRDAHETLYHEMQPGTGAVDWQRYWSWGRAELREIVSSLRCTVHDHFPERIQKWAEEIATDGESSEAFIANDARVEMMVNNRIAEGRADGALNVVFVDFTKEQG